MDDVRRTAAEIDEELERSGPDAGGNDETDEAAPPTGATRATEDEPPSGGERDHRPAEGRPGDAAPWGR